MTGEHLLQPAADWQDENWATRIDRCASMLFLHGYIPMSMREKIGKKLAAQFEKAATEAGWVRKAAPPSPTQDAGGGE